jgi:hypothetical protein
MSPKLFVIPLSAVVFVFYDWIMCHLFISLSRKNTTDRNVIFLNGIAHFQHSFWDNPAGNAFIVRQYQEMLEELTEQLSPEQIDLMNGLEQRKSSNVLVWREKDPPAFFARFFTPLPLSLEQGMTNDTTFRFASAANKTAFESEILNLSIDEKPLFHVEDSGPTFLSIRVDFKTEPVDPWVYGNGKRLFLYKDYFYIYRKRTGGHVKKALWVSTQEHTLPERTNAHLGTYLLAPEEGEEVILKEAN